MCSSVRALAPCRDDCSTLLCDVTTLEALNMSHGFSQSTLYRALPKEGAVYEEREGGPKAGCGEQEQDQSTESLHAQRIERKRLHEFVINFKCSVYKLKHVLLI